MAAAMTVTMTLGRPTVVNVCEWVHEEFALGLLLCFSA